jgi:uncharacterized domain 1
MTESKTISTPNQSGPLSADALREMIQRAPFHKWLGLDLVSVDEESVTIEAPWRDEFVSSVKYGYCHGGVLASLVDLTADFAIAARIGRGAPTVDLRVDYHRTAMPGKLTAVGKVIKLGRTLATAEAQVLDEQGKLVASGRGVFLLAQ